MRFTTRNVILATLSPCVILGMAGLMFFESRLPSIIVGTGVAAIAFTYCVLKGWGDE